MVTLINKTRKMKVFNLDHPFFRSKKWGAKRMTVVVIEEHKDGGSFPREVRRNITGSFTLLAGEKREGLPAQIQAVPEIRKAIRKGLITVVKEADANAKATAKAPTPPAAKPDGKRSKAE